jgi:hypothetical protein
MEDHVQDKLDQLVSSTNSKPISLEKFPMFEYENRGPLDHFNFSYQLSPTLHQKHLPRTPTPSLAHPPKISSKFKKNSLAAI